MKASLLIVLFFILGVLVSYFGLLPKLLLHADINSYVLYLLMFVVGIGIGSDEESLAVLRNIKFRILLIPITIAIGSLAASALFSFLVSDLTLKESMAVGAGFGYYSLSSGIITKIHSDSLGTIALLANVIREIFTLLFAPLLVFLFGKMAPVASGGATAMDTTLPIITRGSGNDMGLIAVFSGIVLTLIVPFLVTIILTF